jgi:4-amino-4-deoxychorismate lyase
MFLLNGEADNTLSLQDRGLHYGDGLFETIAVRGGKIEFWQRHMRRLAEGCRRLQIPVPGEGLLLEEARQLLNEQTDAVLKIIITRGPGGRGYRSPDQAQTTPTRLLAHYDLPVYPDDGVALRLCATRLGLNPALAGIKHLNRLEQVLARSEWRNETVYEGLMLDINDQVIEGTMSNLFFVKAGVLHTPDVSNCGVAGIMRDVIAGSAQQLDVPLHVGHFTLDDLYAADELFICNSLIGLLPAHRLEQQSYSIGPLTKRLSSAIEKVSVNEAL